MRAADEAGVEPVELLVAGEDVEAELLARVSTLAHPPRVIGVYRRESLPRGVEPVWLALWHVADPGNVGTLLRSADAFGASLALVARLCRYRPGQDAARVGRSRVPRADRRLRRAAGARIALVAHEGRPLTEIEHEVPITFVLGAEREGLPEDVVAACDETASIAITPHAESLNVAMAGTVALYEFRRPG